jgi:hypothetical protein
MASGYTDEEIALTLNRFGLRTGVGNTWNKAHVRSLRQNLKLPVCTDERRVGRLILEQSAERLDVSPTVVRRLIERKSFLPHRLCLEHRGKSRRPMLR